MRGFSKVSDIRKILLIPVDENLEDFLGARVLAKNKKAKLKYSTNFAFILPLVKVN